MNLLDLLLGRARKATASAAATGLAAALAAVLPFVDGPLGVAVFVALAVLAAFGFTYATPPNDPPAHLRPKGRVNGTPL